MGHMSNKERISRAAEEARLTAAQKAEKTEKATKKTAKVATGSRPKRVVRPVRMKIIWEVCNGAGTALKAFTYPEKPAAEAATDALTKSTGRTHILRATKVPME